MIDYNDIFVDKTHCLVFQACTYTEEFMSWIGGRAPAFFDDKEDLINNSDRKYHFYLSLVNPLQKSQMLSIFIPIDFEDYLDNNIYPNCSILLIEHPITPESDLDIFTNPGLVKHSIDNGEIVSEKVAMNQSFFIKMGGYPRLIQDEEYYLSELTNDSFDFMFQVDEDGYPRTVVKGNMPFNFGALYVCICSN